MPNKIIISDEISQLITKLTELAEVKNAMSFLETDNENTAAEQIQLTEIPAPSFKEDKRASWIAERFRALGLKDIVIDEEGNVTGLYDGKLPGPKIVIAAHLDTVFPEGTDTKATIKSGTIYAPGISDDGRGLGVLLSIIRAIRSSGIKPQHSILFVADVGEEGLGDLRGVKALFRTHNDIGGFISIEPGNPAALTCTAVGSHRYHVRFRGPGGHSFAAFGTPSAVHALGRAISYISDMNVPENPVTTFTVGTVKGGTSINTIAEDAVMSLDMRSVSMDSLLALEKQALSLIRKAADEENKRWHKESAIEVSFEKVGERPAGTQAPNQPIVQAAAAAVNFLGYSPRLQASSTDANVPISLGIPAVTMSGGGISGKEHTLGEFFNPEKGFLGAQAVLITLLALTGSGSTDSLIL
ncbi:M20/M25/M40 family metallo-hydrolase [Sporolactobacillus pectinivorans]|uniref:M20/M25/M40 family metallo-hydrolase n=1 Tax=Sporolactobacillus pectinivorans TaxID=1591408 RepID=UPI000C2649A1|nr:M20/M25/M40 family metallo-hydrolase [Sporolactobacillus pectinivorans]